MKDRQKQALLIMITAGFMVRVIVSWMFPPHPIDMNCFKAWAVHAANSLPMFYTGDMFVDYPPGYIYILFVVGLIQKLLKLAYDSGAFTLLVKLPAIFADLLACYFIYFTAEAYNRKKIALFLTAIYAFNPAIILNSSVWGQVDSFFTLFVVLFIHYVIKNRLPLASAMLAIAILIKPQAAIFGPILLFSLIEKKNVAEFFKCCLSGILSVVAGIAIFCVGKGGVVWVFSLYAKTLASYPYATLNAANLYALVGSNWAAVTDRFAFISYQSWGNVAFFLIAVSTTYIFFKSKGDSKYYLTSLLLILSVFMLVPKMHERYLFPAMLLSLLLGIVLNNVKILYLYGAISVSQLLNVWQVYAYSIKEVYQVPSNSVLLISVSILNMAILVYLAFFTKQYVLHPENSTAKPNDIIEKVTSAAKPEKREKNIGVSILQPYAKTPFTKADLTLVIILTAVYTFIALFNLGSMQAPESGWMAAGKGESVTIDLGTAKQVDKIRFFQGRGVAPYKIYWEDTNGTWQNAPDMSANYVFTWNEYTLAKEVKQLRIEAQSTEAELNEVALVLPGGQFLAPEKTTPNGKTLFDEQDKNVSMPSYLNSMYFDEIYHGRTAFEFLHHMQPYEWTHPPFGKILIAAGVALFGMNPFGWRIIGTLFGILMLPLMYVFAKQLFKKSQFAFLATFLLAFDFMHFTQSRIATIDVYTAFFNLAMFYFMYKYHEIGFFRITLKQSLVYLALCGLFFGLGLATKWITLYGGMGLAIVFFYSLYERYEEYLYAKKMVGLSGKSNANPALKQKLEQIVQNFTPYAIKTLCWCVIFFIVLPLIIYCASYIPFLSVQGQEPHFSTILKNQKDMLSYHSQLKATHPFSSNWYEWPIMKKPIWYYTANSYLPQNKISSIVAFGNPAIWWLGIPALAGCLYLAWKKGDKSMLTVIVAFLALYLPWALVPRLVFIYHYFSPAVFSIFFIVYIIKYWQEKNPNARYSIYLYMAVVLGLFILFYPVLSGYIVDRSFVDNFLKWMKGWYF